MERRLGLLAAGLLMIALVVGGLILLVRAGGSDHIEGDVVIFGDSVTHLSADPIVDQVGAEDLESLAVPGFRSTDLLPVLQGAIGDRGGSDSDGLQKAAFLVGYNDVLDDALEENVLAEMVELSSQFDCAVWLALPGGFGDETDDLLRSEIDRYESVHFDTGWAEAVEADRSLLQDDGVHPNQDGARALAEAYREALDDRCDSGPVPVP